MPSRASLGGPVRIDGPAVMRRVREERDRFVGVVLEAVDGFDDGHLIRSHARFENDSTLVLDDGRRVRAGAIVIATGSRPAAAASFEAAGDRPRLERTSLVLDARGVPAYDALPMRCGTSRVVVTEAGPSGDSASGRV